MRFELGSVSSLWPEQWSALLSTSPPDGWANNRGGWVSARSCLWGTRERGQISNVWLGSYSLAELLPSTSWQTPHPPIPPTPHATQTWISHFWNRLKSEMMAEDKYSSISFQFPKQFHTQKLWLYMYGDFSQKSARWNNWRLIAMRADQIAVFATRFTVKADVVTLSFSSRSRLTLAAEKWHHRANLDEDKKPVVNGNLSEVCHCQLGSLLFQHL